MIEVYKDWVIDVDSQYIPENGIIRRAISIATSIFRTLSRRCGHCERAQGEATGKDMS